MALPIHARREGRRAIGARGGRLAAWRTCLGSRLRGNDGVVGVGLNVWTVTDVIPAELGIQSRRHGCVLSMLMRARQATALKQSSDDVGEELVLDDGDLILQRQLLLLQALDQQLVGAAGRLQLDDLVIEGAMLGAQAYQLLAKLFFIATLHRRRCPFPLPDRHARPLDERQAGTHPGLKHASTAYREEHAVFPLRHANTTRSI